MPVIHNKNAGLRIGLALLLCTAVPMLPLRAMAQEAVPSSAEAPRTEGQVPAPQDFIIPAPITPAPDLAPQAVPEGAQDIVFSLNGIRVEGVSAYDGSRFTPLYEGMIGGQVNLGDMFALARDITRAYRADGYILSQAVVPPQTVTDGVITIRVVEGHFSALDLEGVDETTLLGRRIRRIAERITAEKPATAATLERNLLLINDMAGVSARSIITPDTDITGGARLGILVSEDLVSGRVSVDNYGSRYIGPIQISNVTSLNNAIGLGERVTAQVVGVPQSDEMIYGYGLFQLPVNASGTVVGLDVTYSETEPGYTLDDFNVAGQSALFGGEVRYPFIRGRAQNLYGRLRFDWRRATSKSDIDVTRTDKIAAMRLGLDYQGLDNALWAPGVTTMRLDLSKGLDLLDASHEGDTNLSRANGDAQAAKMELSIERLQRIGGGFTALIRAEGQYASDALLSAEEFGVGGNHLGRGYSPSEITGDHGLAGSFELQWHPASLDGKILQKPQVFGFYDVGKVWNLSEVASVQKKNSLASSGLGLRSGLFGYVEGELYVAFPLTRDIATADDRGPNVFFSVSVPY